MEHMEFPEDYSRDEKENIGIAEFLSMLVTNLKLTESARGCKTRDPSTLLDSMGLVLALFESNDFDLFRNVLRVDSPISTFRLSCYVFLLCKYHNTTLLSSAEKSSVM